MSEPEKRLLTRQKNKLYKLINPEIFKPNEFRLTYDDDLDEKVRFQNPRFIYQKDNRYFFQIILFNGSDTYSLYMAPGKTKHTDGQSNVGWDGVLVSFSNWLKILDEEVNSPDLWALGESLSGETDSNFEFFAVDEPFSLEQHKSMSEQIGTMRREMQAQFELDNQQFEILKELLSHLDERLDKLSRFDWRNLATGLFVNLGSAAAFNPQKAGEIFQYFTNLISGVLPISG